MGRDTTIPLLTEVEKFLKTKNLNCKWLFATEYIMSGHSLSMLDEMMKKLKVTYDVAVQNITKHPKEFKNIQAKIIYGKINLVHPETYRKKELLGVEKEKLVSLRTEPHTRTLEKKVFTISAK